MLGLPLKLSYWQTVKSCPQPDYSPSRRAAQWRGDGHFASFHIFCKIFKPINSFQGFSLFLNWQYFFYIVPSIPPIKLQ